MRQVQFANTAPSDAMLFIKRLLRILIGLLLLFMAVSVWEKKNGLESSPVAVTATVPPAIGQENTPITEPAEQTNAPIAAETPEAVAELPSPAPTLHSSLAQRSPNKTENYRQFAASLYTLPAYNPDKRSDGDPVLEAEKDLWRKEFSKAAARLDSIKSNSDQHAAAQRIRAHLLFQQGKTAEAAQIFESMKNEENDIYLLLCYLSNGHNNFAAFANMADQLQKKTDFKQKELLQTYLAKLSVLQKEGKL